MRPQLRKHIYFFLTTGCLLGLLLCVGTCPVSAQSVVLHLKSGDQISGVIISQSTNQVVVSNAWVKTLPVPLSAIASRETITNTPAVAAAAKPAPKPKPQPKEVAKKSAKPAKSTQVAAASKPASLPRSKPRGKWKGQVNVGLDALVSTRNQQNYFGKLRLVYTLPYASNPKKFFRNTAEFSGQYQRTDGQESANRANASDKSDFDIGTKSYGYFSSGVGFDEVRKIDKQFQLGPGMGSHLIRNDDTALNVESGLNYQAQYRRNTDNLESFFLRLAQDWTWKIRKNLKLVQKFEFLPNLEPVDFGQYQLGFNSTLSYGFWKNLSLDLTADDNYNTQVAPQVSRNEFEVRLMLGATF